MSNLLLAIQMIVGIILSLLVLIQSKNGGLGSTFGSQVSFTRRGLEQFVFKLTFILAAVFIILSILSVL
jgi:protein translocase SecG subunit